MFDEQQGESVYEAELEKEFQRVMAHDAAVRHGYHTAKSFKMNESDCLRAAIVSCSNARQNLMDKLIEEFGEK